MDADPLVECMTCHMPVPASCAQAHCDEHHAGSTPRLQTPGVEAPRQEIQRTLDALTASEGPT